MSRRDPMVRLRHMLNYARATVRITAGRSRADLDLDESFALAVTHAIGMIGEAASQVPPEVRAQRPGVPWRAIVGMRHRLIHGYEEISFDLLWRAAMESVPPLIAELERILSPEDPP